jgi:hypothetical protein
MIRVGHDLLEHVVMVVRAGGFACCGVKRDDGDGVSYRVGFIDFTIILAKSTRHNKPGFVSSGA